jgi:hypothetical protein
VCVSVCARVCALKALDYVWFNVIFSHFFSFSFSSSQVKLHYKSLTPRHKMSVVKLRADQLFKILTCIKPGGIFQSS